MTVVEYEKRFHDLSLFAPHYVPTEQHMIDRLRDRLRPDLKQGLITHRFSSMKDLIEAAQALETCIAKNQSQVEYVKRKAAQFSFDRPPLSKKGKNVQFKKKIESFGQDRVPERFSQGTTRGQTFQRTITYPRCVRCERNHRGDCSASPSRCYIC